MPEIVISAKTPVTVPAKPPEEYSDIRLLDVHIYDTGPGEPGTADVTFSPYNRESKIAERTRARRIKITDIAKKAEQPGPMQNAWIWLVIAVEQEMVAQGIATPRE